MRPLFFIALFVICRPVSAQDPAAAYQHEAGINAIGLFANYLSFNDFIESNNPYIFTYKHTAGPGAIRCGLNVYADRSNEHWQKDANKTQRSYSSSDVRIGYQWDLPIHHSVNLYYGLDLSFHQLTNDTREMTHVWFNGSHSATRISDYQRYEYGFAPVAGIQWYITDRISLFTECNIKAFYSEYKSDTHWEDLPEVLQNQSGYAKSIYTDFERGVNMMIPLDIYLSFRF